MLDIYRVHQEKKRLRDLFCLNESGEVSQTRWHTSSGSQMEEKLARLQDNYLCSPNAGGSKVLFTRSKLRNSFTKSI